MTNFKFLMANKNQNQNVKNFFAVNCPTQEFGVLLEICNLKFEIKNDEKQKDEDNIFSSFLLKLFMLFLHIPRFQCLS